MRLSVLVYGFSLFKLGVNPKNTSSETKALPIDLEPYGGCQSVGDNPI